MTFHALVTTFQPMTRMISLPRTAPFSDAERQSLGEVLSGSSVLQRAWLAGFIAGLDAAEGGALEAAPVPAVAARAATPLTILYASESGNCERLAQDMAKRAKAAGFKPKVIDFADLDLSTLPKAGQLAVIAATWGEGDPPSRAERAFKDLMGDGAPRLDGLPFAVLALGDTAYVEFCAIGKALDARLEALGGQRVVDRVDCDLDFETPAAAFIGAALKALAPAEADSNVVAVDFSARAGGEPSRDPVLAEVAEHIILTSSRSDKETLHLALAFENGAPAYEPGDALEIFPQNDPALVAEILSLAGLSGKVDLSAKLISERDITTLSPVTLEKFATATGNAAVRALIEGGDARAYLEGRQIVDLLVEFPAALSAEALLDITRPLPPRAYSIASSRKEVGEEAHLLVAAVRYEAHGRARAGVGSSYLIDRVKTGGSVKARLKPNKHFRLPDAGTDIIMVGPGTGVAPFRAFVQERRAVGATGRNWLFFGERRYTHDFLYQLEWQDALKDGSLSRIDLAFSRDTPKKIYVQHRLAERARDVVDWLENGAVFYVCGDAKAMAKDVRAALVAAYGAIKALSAEDAEAAVAKLERDKRYLQDVY